MLECAGDIVFAQSRCELCDPFEWSLLGRRHGTEGLLKYTEVQTVASQATWLGFEPILGMTYDKYADTLAGLLKTMKRLHLK